MRLPVVAVLLALTFGALGRPAEALPVFAHRYGLTCQACHTTVPHLNAFGEAFAKNGFRLAAPRHGEMPVAVKVQLAYSSDAEPGLPKAVVDEVEVLTGGAIGTKFNYFLEQYAVDGGMPGATRDAWLQYNGAALHVRAGQFTLPLPVDPETQRDTLAHYLAYDQRVGNNSFTFFDPRGGVDAFADSARVRAHFAVLAGGDLMSSAAVSAGALTLHAYRYQGQRFDRSTDNFYRQGFGTEIESGKIGLTGIVQYGNDTSADASGTPARSTAGFVQARYAFSDALTAVARYDHTWDALDGSENQTVLSIVTRPARNMRITLEDAITSKHTLGIGWLFAY